MFDKEIGADSAVRRIVNVLKNVANGSFEESLVLLDWKSGEVLPLRAFAHAVADVAGDGEWDALYVDYDAYKAPYRVSVVLLVGDALVTGSVTWPLAEGVEAVGATRRWLVDVVSVSSQRVPEFGRTSPPDQLVVNASRPSLVVTFRDGTEVTLSGDARSLPMESQLEQLTPERLWSAVNAARS